MDACGIGDYCLREEDLRFGLVLGEFCLVRTLAKSCFVSREFFFVNFLRANLLDRAGFLGRDGRF